MQQILVRNNKEKVYSVHVQKTVEFLSVFLHL